MPVIVSLSNRKKMRTEITNLQSAVKNWGTNLSAITTILNSATATTFKQEYNKGQEIMTKLQEIVRQLTNAKTSLNNCVSNSTLFVDYHDKLDGKSSKVATTTSKTNTSKTNTSKTNTSKTNSGKTNTSKTNTSKTNTSKTTTSKTNTSKTTTSKTTSTNKKK